MLGFSGTTFRCVHLANLSASSHEGWSLAKCSFQGPTQSRTTTLSLSLLDLAARPRSGAGGVGALTGHA